MNQEKKKKEPLIPVRVQVGNANHEHPHHHENGFAIKWGETIGNVECPLMKRWVFEVPLGSLRLHHFMKSDDDRSLHDHPWWFFTLPLKGGYTDITYCRDCEKEPAGLNAPKVENPVCKTCEDSGYASQAVRVFRPRFRPAHHCHAVMTEGCWSLIVTGRKIHPWGFWSKAGKFFESRKYFGLFGHAPCE